MLLGGVQIPADLLTAQDEGKLVIFTGAGVSIGAPSNLPTFLGLARQVATKLQSPLNPDLPKWRSQLDAFMDVINEGHGANVHQLVRGIVTDSASSPNPNHYALARIAAHGTVRVVTTNYDLHLETALRDHDRGDLKVFSAPALPLGSDFDGLVYLHGSASQEPRHLIVTDRDFSHAYFHGAWATRFLERMFAEYTVLFVGYSHTDVVMKYLGLGLGPKSKRYVLTDDPDDELWKRLQMTAVLGYPKGRHDILTQCLTEWADYGGMGLLDHRQRIRELVSSPSVPTPDELSYLQDSLRRSDRVRFFCDYATSEFWLDWAQQEDPFRRLFSRATEHDDVTRRLAYWFAGRFALADKELSDKAWVAFAKAGGVLGTTLWGALAQEIHAYSGPRPEHVLRWVWVLLEQEHAGCWTDLLDYALEWEGVWSDQNLSLALLGHLMAPRLVPERLLDDGRMTVETRGKRYGLERSWRDRFGPELAVLAPVVFPVVEAALLRHLNLEARVTRSPIQFHRRRSAIQPHEQDQFPEPVDLVIDAVRDSVVALWDDEPEFVRHQVDRWLVSDHALLRRLAVHTMAADPAADANQQVRFVLDRDLTAVREVAQEVFDLLRTTAKDADAELVDRLVGAYEPPSDDERELYNSYVALEWLERSGVENERLATTLHTIRARLGDVVPSPYPGLTGWMRFGTDHENPPLSVDDFDKQIQGSPASAITFLLGFEEQMLPRSDEPSRHDAVSMLRDTVRQRPSAGLELWPHLAPHLDGHLALQEAIVSAWGHASVPADMGAIIGALVDADLLNIKHAIGQFLIHANGNNAARWEQAPAIDTFIQRVWDACETQDVYEPDGERDWLTETINAPAGLLVDFWLEIFRRRWAAAGEDWDGLPEADRNFLDQALVDRTERGAYALTQLAGRLHFLDAADSTWCRTRLLPLGDWTDVQVAEPYWWGVLSMARWNSGLVEDGLLAGLMATTPHLKAFQDNQAMRWADFLASIAVRCETPAARTWVAQLTALTTDETNRVRWLQAIASQLEDLDPPGRAATWTGWLSAYWSQRATSDPVPLTPAEATELAAMAPLAPPEEFAAAVELAIATAAGIDPDGSSPRHVTDRLIDTQPDIVGRFLTSLMNNTAQPFWGSYELKPKLLRLLDKPGDWRAVHESALRLGIDLP